MTAVNIEAADKFSPVAQEMGRWIDRILGPEFHPYRSRHAWTPSVNLYEDSLAYYLVADLGGIDPGKIDLRVEARQLVLRGERPAPRPPVGECGPDKASSSLRLHVMEIDHGPFVRAVEMPAPIDADKVEACYRHGFLWVKIRKVAARRTKVTAKPL